MDRFLRGQNASEAALPAFAQRQIAATIQPLVPMWLDPLVLNFLGVWDVGTKFSVAEA